MPSPTLARNNKQGQSLVEASLVLSLITITCGTILGLILMGAASAFLSLDSFMIARAHLYRQRPYYCFVSKLWPSNRLLRPSYECQGLEIHVRKVPFPISWKLSQ